MWFAQVYASDDKQEVDLAHIVGKCSVLPAGSELPGALAVEQAFPMGVSWFWHADGTEDFPIEAGLF